MCSAQLLQKWTIIQQNPYSHFRKIRSLRHTGGGEHEESATDLDSSQRKREHLVACHLKSVITHFILDENQESCNNEREQTIMLLHREWSKEIEPSRQNSTHHPLIVSNPIDTLQPVTTHCNTLQHTATHCDALRRTRTHLQHTATHCNTLQRTATTVTHLNTLQRTATHRNALQCTATCNTLQHPATHYSTAESNLMPNGSAIYICVYEYVYKYVGYIHIHIYIFLL